MFRRIINKLRKKLCVNEIRLKIITIKSDGRLRGKRILVTGGGRGLGFEMAKKFQAEGAQVLILGRSAETLKTASEEIGCKFLQFDISNVSDAEDIIKGCVDLLGGVDCLVNNAGISLHERDFFEVTPKSWDTQFDTNLRGPFFFTQKFVKYLVSNNQSGSILFISSETGNTCDIRPYGFTKAAINSMVEGMAFLLKNKGIRINAIAPGITASAMTGISSEGNLYAGTYGQGRFYLPEEIAEVAAFLLSDVSDCISGQIITCNNAQTVNARWKK